ncbi:MAG TPA: DNA methyltransferase [Nitrospiraceae bacterium]
MTAAVEEVKVPTGTLKHVLLGDITVGERFRKDFSDDKEFVESVREKGIIQPITLDKHLNLLAGERRYRAAKEVGLDKIPALIRAISDEIDAREIEVVENLFRKDFTWQEKCRGIQELDRLYRAKNQDWDQRKTAKLLNQPKSNIWRTLQVAQAMQKVPELALQPSEFDAFKLLKAAEERIYVDEIARRHNEELGKAIAIEAAENEGRTEEAAALPRSKYSPDLAAKLKMAHANYMIGDIFTELADMEDTSYIHLIECDPPYGIDLPEIRAGDKESTPTYNKSYEEIPIEQYPEFLLKLCTELYRVAHRDCWMIFWFASKNHSLVKEVLLTTGWKLDHVPAIWVKPQGQTMQVDFLLSRHYEPFFICYKGKPYINKRGRPNVFQFPLVPASQKIHPTERPIELIEEILDTFGIVGQVVFVPFLGSGNTLRACYRKQRACYGVEINPEYKSRFMLACEQDFRSMTQPVKETENANTPPNPSGAGSPLPFKLGETR